MEKIKVRREKSFWIITSAQLIDILEISYEKKNSSTFKKRGFMLSVKSKSTLDIP